MKSNADNHGDDNDSKDVSLFESIVDDISTKGYSVRDNALEPVLLDKLNDRIKLMSAAKFKRAGVGRHDDHTVKDLVRTDEISWIEGDCDAEAAWIGWAESLQAYVNRRLFLGLFSFESHFAHYAPGDFYKKHQDSFKGEANRVLSIVVYLNKDWLPDSGGELLIYTADAGQSPVKVTPAYGTVAIFLSEEFPHEVLPSRRDRFSIAGWFRVNSSNFDRIDPPK